MSSVLHRLLRGFGVTLPEREKPVIEQPACSAPVSIPPVERQRSKREMVATYFGDPFQQHYGLYSAIASVGDAPPRPQQKPDRYVPVLDDKYFEEKRQPVGFYSASRLHYSGSYYGSGSHPGATWVGW